MIYLKNGLFDAVFVWAGGGEFFKCGDLQVEKGRFADAGAILLRSV